MANPPETLNFRSNLTTDQHISPELPGMQSEYSSAAPFIKWAGGKRSLIKELEPFFPDHINCYWEPFLGGGAVFFAFHARMDKAVLSDANEELIIAYHVVKTNVEALILRLKLHAEEHRQESYFSHVRSQKPKSDLEIAARFIYLNKTCFNGLYRVNSKGDFNVPKGDYRNPRICDEPRLLAASAALQIAKLLVGDFERVVKARSGDFIYCDPPYDACFSNYQPNGFSDDDQGRLKKAATKWVTSQCGVGISNSATQKINKLYRGSDFTKHIVEAPRFINSDPSGRGAVKEVVITGNV